MSSDDVDAQAVDALVDTSHHLGLLANSAFAAGG